MKRFAILLLACATLMAALGVIWVPLPSSQILNLSIQSILSRNDSPRVCAVVLSNSVDSTVLYAASGPGSRGHPLVDVSYVTNDVRGCSYEVSISACMMEMLPHQSLIWHVEVPNGATHVKLELHVTELTWRGQLGLRIAGSSSNCIRTYISALLVGLDNRRRSRDESFGPFELSDSTESFKRGREN